MTVGFVGLLALVVAGCASGAEGVEAPAPSSSARPSAEATVEYVPASESTPVAPAAPASDAPVVRASAETIPPAPEVMAGMECEPLSDETRDYIPAEQTRRPVEPVQVLIGEGLTPGELWWVVAFERNNEAAVNQAWITTQPGVDGQGKWLNISSGRVLPDGSVGSEWHNVHWDHDRLVRGQSALRVALDCLEG